MTRIYRLRQGLMGQEVNAAETPLRQLRWLTRGTQFFIHHDKHAWVDGCFGQYYCTILVEGACKCYNVSWSELEPLMEEVEHKRLLMGEPLRRLARAQGAGASR
jgi:hypothetical protein